MPHPVDLAAHDSHDAELVAAYAAGDATGADLSSATALVAACAACAQLHRDLRVIAAALPELPAPARSRDFRLTPDQAASLRPAGWRRLLVPLAGPRFSFAVPVGSGLAALGLAGILLGSLAGLPLGAGGAASATIATDGSIRAAAGGAASQAPSAGPAEANEVQVQGEAATSPADGEVPVMAPEPGSPTSAVPPMSEDVSRETSGVGTDAAAGLAIAALLLGSALVLGRVLARRLARPG